VKCFLILNRMILFTVNTRDCSISSSGGEIFLFSKMSHSSSRAQPVSYSVRNRDSFSRSQGVTDHLPLSSSMVKNEWMFNFRVEEINPISISGWVDRVIRGLFRGFLRSGGQMRWEDNP